jgi:ATP-dependent Clp protease adaptor protein ClpS
MGELSLEGRLAIIIAENLPTKTEGGNDEGEGDGAYGGTETLTRPAVKAKIPSFFKVLLLNDDFTPREFVVHVLQKYFKKSENDAIQIMLHVHHKGVGVAGVYTFEIAETKAFQVNEYSKKNKYPLKCTVEGE